MGPYGIGGIGIGGMSPKRWEQAGNSDAYYLRWEGAYAPDTVMTPATADHIAFNPDARFIDFAPPEMSLFGVTGDGTIGPLGFGKMLGASGKFDRCSVRRFPS